MGMKNEVVGGAGASESDLINIEIELHNNPCGDVLLGRGVIGAKQYFKFCLCLFKE